MDKQRQQVVCIVDDDPYDRRTHAEIFKRAGCSTRLYSCGISFLRDLDEVDACCVVLDVRLPDISGLEIIKEITTRRPDLPIVMASGSSDIPIAVRAMRMGATDFIQKPVDPDHLLEICRSVEKMPTRRHEAKPQNKLEEKKTALLDRLTPREMQVLRLLLDGYQNKMVAYRLGISERTVEVHRAKIMRRLNVRTFAELVKLAVQAQYDEQGLGGGAA